MAEQAYSRYLASFLKQNENYFLRYSQRDECDVVDEFKLQEKIEEFIQNQF